MSTSEPEMLTMYNTRKGPSPNDRRVPPPVSHAGNKAIWDVDGTLLRDLGDYTTKTIIARNTNVVLLAQAKIFLDRGYTNVIVTGRPSEQLHALKRIFKNPPFFEIITRNNDEIPLLPKTDYLQRYRRWKLGIIRRFSANNYVIVFDDDDAILSAVRSYSITAIDAKRFW